jgi:hypothetical protein
MVRNMILLLAGLGCLVLAAAMCGQPHSDAGDNGANGDDDTGQIDYFESNCEGFSFPECSSDVNVPPVLEDVTLLLDGKPFSMPATLPMPANLALRLAFAFPKGLLAGGHVFVVRAGEAMCLDEEGRPFDNPATENDIYQTAGPIDWPVDPTLFLDGEGAPYYVEISNGCGTHSNRLPLEIVTVESE